MLITTLISINILVGALALYAVYLNAQAKVAHIRRQKVQALAYAAELSEYFRSLTNAQLQTYLSTNPITGSSLTTHQYPLCAHINLFDRVNSTPTNKLILNADPIADLPPKLIGPARLEGCSNNSDGNRYYQVQVVDAGNNFAMVPAACGQKPSTYALAPNERFLVSVGVSWVPCKSNAEPERVVLSTVLPQ